VSDFGFLDKATDADLATAAKAPSADWAAALDQSAQEKVRAAVVGAQDANPDHAAQALTLGGKTGIPAEVALRNLGDVKRKAYLDDVERVFAEEPALAKWHMSPINAQLTRDDLANIEKLPSLWRGLGDLGRSVPGGVVRGTGTALGGVGDMMASADRSLNRLSDLIVSPVFPDAAKTRADLEARGSLWSPSKGFIGLGGAVKDVGKAIEPPVERQNITDKVASGVGAFVPLIAAEIIGGPALATTMMAGQGADQQADLARAAGKYGTAQGDEAVAAGAAVNAMLQRLGFEALLYRMPTQMRSAVLAKLTDVTVGGGIQAAQQLVLTAAQNVVTKTYLDPKQTVFDPAPDDRGCGGRLLHGRHRSRRHRPGQSRAQDPAGARLCRDRRAGCGQP
jgi:hypothetical protein